MFQFQTTPLSPFSPSWHESIDTLYQHISAHIIPTDVPHNQDFFIQYNKRQITAESTKQLHKTFVSQCSSFLSSTQPVSQLHSKAPSFSSSHSQEATIPTHCILYHAYTLHIIYTILFYLHRISPQSIYSFINDAYINHCDHNQCMCYIAPANSDTQHKNNNSSNSSLNLQRTMQHQQQKCFWHYITSHLTPKTLTQHYYAQFNYHFYYQLPILLPLQFNSHFSIKDYIADENYQHWSNLYQNDPILRSSCLDFVTSIHQIPLPKGSTPHKINHSRETIILQSPTSSKPSLNDDNTRNNNSQIPPQYHNSHIYLKYATLHAENLLKYSILLITIYKTALFPPLSFPNPVISYRNSLQSIFRDTSSLSGNDQITPKYFDINGDFDDDYQPMKYNCFSSIRSFLQNAVIPQYYHQLFEKLITNQRNNLVKKSDDSMGNNIETIQPLMTSFNAQLAWFSTLKETYIQYNHKFPTKMSQCPSNAINSLLDNDLSLESLHNMVYSFDTPHYIENHVLMSPPKPNFADSTLNNTRISPQNKNIIPGYFIGRLTTKPPQRPSPNQTSLNSSKTTQKSSKCDPFPYNPPQRLQNLDQQKRYNFPQHSDDEVQDPFLDHPGENMHDDEFDTIEDPFSIQAEENIANYNEINCDIKTCLDSPYYHDYTLWLEDNSCSIPISVKNSLICQNIDDIPSLFHLKPQKDNNSPNKSTFSSTFDPLSTFQFDQREQSRIPHFPPQTLSDIIQYNHQKDAGNIFDVVHSDISLNKQITSYYPAFEDKLVFIPLGDIVIKQYDSQIIQSPTFLDLHLEAYTHNIWIIPEIIPFSRPLSTTDKAGKNNDKDWSDGSQFTFPILSPVSLLFIPPQTQVYMDFISHESLKTSVRFNQYINMTWHKYNNKYVQNPVGMNFPTLGRHIINMLYPYQPLLSTPGKLCGNSKHCSILSQKSHSLPSTIYMNLMTDIIAPLTATFWADITPHSEKSQAPVSLLQYHQQFRENNHNALHYIYNTPQNYILLKLNAIIGQSNDRQRDFITLLEEAKQKGKTAKLPKNLEHHIDVENQDIILDQYIQHTHNIHQVKQLHSQLQQLFGLSEISNQAQNIDDLSHNHNPFDISISHNSIGPASFRGYSENDERISTNISIHSQSNSIFDFLGNFDQHAKSTSNSQPDNNMFVTQSNNPFELHSLFKTNSQLPQLSQTNMQIHPLFPNTFTDNTLCQNPFLLFSSTMGTEVQNAINIIKNTQFTQNCLHSHPIDTTVAHPPIPLIEQNIIQVKQTFSKVLLLLYIYCLSTPYFLPLVSLITPPTLTYIDTSFDAHGTNIESFSNGENNLNHLMKSAGFPSLLYLVTSLIPSLQPIIWDTKQYWYYSIYLKHLPWYIFCDTKAVLEALLDSNSITSPRNQLSYIWSTTYESSQNNQKYPKVEDNLPSNMLFGSLYFHPHLGLLFKHHNITQNEHVARKTSSSEHFYQLRCFDDNINFNDYQHIEQINSRDKTSVKSQLLPLDNSDSRNGDFFHLYHTIKEKHHDISAYCDKCSLKINQYNSQLATTHNFNCLDFCCLCSCHSLNVLIKMYTFFVLFPHSSLDVSISTLFNSFSSHRVTDAPVLLRESEQDERCITASTQTTSSSEHPDVTQPRLSHPSTISSMLQLTQDMSADATTQNITSWASHILQADPQYMLIVQYFKHQLDRLLSYVVEPISQSNPTQGNSDMGYINGTASPVRSDCIIYTSSRDIQIFTSDNKKSPISFQNREKFSVSDLLLNKEQDQSHNLISIVLKKCLSPRSPYSPNTVFFTRFIYSLLMQETFIAFIHFITTKYNCKHLLPSFLSDSFWSAVAQKDTSSHCKTIEFKIVELSYPFRINLSRENDIIRNHPLIKEHALHHPPQHLDETDCEISVRLVFIINHLNQYSFLILHCDDYYCSTHLVQYTVPTQPVLLDTLKFSDLPYHATFSLFQDHKNTPDQGTMFDFIEFDDTLLKMCLFTDQDNTHSLIDPLMLNTSANDNNYNNSKNPSTPNSSTSQVFSLKDSLDVSCSHDFDVSMSLDDSNENLSTDIPHHQHESNMFNFRPNLLKKNKFKQNHCDIEDIFGDCDEDNHIDPFIFKEDLKTIDKNTHRDSELYYLLYTKISNLIITPPPNVPIAATSDPNSITSTAPQKTLDPLPVIKNDDSYQNITGTLVHTHIYPFSFHLAKSVGIDDVDTLYNPTQIYHFYTQEDDLEHNMTDTLLPGNDPSNLPLHMQKKSNHGSITSNLDSNNTTTITHFPIIIPFSQSHPLFLYNIPAIDVESMYSVLTNEKLQLLRLRTNHFICYLEYVKPHHHQFSVLVQYTLLLHPKDQSPPVNPNLDQDNFDNDENMLQFVTIYCMEPCELVRSPTVSPNKQPQFSLKYHLPPVNSVMTFYNIYLSQYATNPRFDDFASASSLFPIPPKPKQEFVEIKKSRKTTRQQPTSPTSKNNNRLNTTIPPIMSMNTVQRIFISSIASNYSVHSTLLLSNRQYSVTQSSSQLYHNLLPQNSSMNKLNDNSTSSSFSQLLMLSPQNVYTICPFQLSIDPSFKNIPPQSPHLHALLANPHLSSIQKSLYTPISALMKQHTEATTRVSSKPFGITTLPSISSFTVNKLLFWITCPNCLNCNDLDFSQWLGVLKCCKKCFYPCSNTTLPIPIPRTASEVDGNHKNSLLGKSQPEIYQPVLPLTITLYNEDYNCGLSPLNSNINRQPRQIFNLPYHHQKSIEAAKFPKQYDDYIEDLMSYYHNSARHTFSPAYHTQLQYPSHVRTRRLSNIKDNARSDSIPTIAPSSMGLYHDLNQYYDNCQPSQYQMLQKLYHLQQLFLYKYIHIPIIQNDTGPFLGVDNLKVVLNESIPSFTTVSVFPVQETSTANSTDSVLYNDLILITTSTPQIISYEASHHHQGIKSYNITAAIHPENQITMANTTIIIPITTNFSSFISQQKQDVLKGNTFSFIQSLLSYSLDSHRITPARPIIIGLDNELPVQKNDTSDLLPSEAISQQSSLHKPRDVGFIGISSHATLNPWLTVPNTMSPGLLSSYLHNCIDRTSSNHSTLPLEYHRHYDFLYKSVHKILSSSAQLSMNSSASNTSPILETKPWYLNGIIDCSFTDNTFASSQSYITDINLILYLLNLSSPSLSTTLLNDSTLERQAHLSTIFNFIWGLNGLKFEYTPREVNNYLINSLVQEDYKANMLKNTHIYLFGSNIHDFSSPNIVSPNLDQEKSFFRYNKFNLPILQHIVTELNYSDDSSNPYASSQSCRFPNISTHFYNNNNGFKQNFVFPLSNHSQTLSNISSSSINIQQYYSLLTYIKSQIAQLPTTLLRQQLSLYIVPLQYQQLQFIHYNIQRHFQHQARQDNRVNPRNIVNKTTNSINGHNYSVLTSYYPYLYHMLPFYTQFYKSIGLDLTTGVKKVVDSLIKENNDSGYPFQSSKPLERPRNKHIDNRGHYTGVNPPHIIANNLQLLFSVLVNYPADDSQKMLYILQHILLLFTPTSHSSLSTDHTLIVGCTSNSCHLNNVRVDTVLSQFQEIKQLLYHWISNTVDGKHIHNSIEAGLSTLQLNDRQSIDLDQLEQFMGDSDSDNLFTAMQQPVTIDQNQDNKSVFNSTFDDFDLF